MKPAEEVTREIITIVLKPESTTVRELEQEVSDIIQKDRIETRKKCAEVAKNYMCDCEQNDNGDDCSDLIAKAIEEISL